MQVEWHDAEVERIQLFPDGEAEVSFRQLYTFEQGASGATTRMRAGTLLLRGVRRVSLTGQFVSDGYVSFAVVEPGLSADALVGGAEVRRIEFQFTNGANVQFELERAVLKID